jgi:hypothetical protein
MWKDGVECCDDCGLPLPGGTARVLDDETLCERCYAKKAKSVRWIMTQVVADTVLLAIGLVAFILVWHIPVIIYLKFFIWAGALYSVFLARPHVHAMVKDILMRRKAH